MKRKSSFPPVVAADTRVLVLGSLPGERSLAAGQYYAYPQNRFWHLMGGVIGRDLEGVDYDDRLAGLLAAGVGLWDTVASATRTGSLDADIRAPEHNELAELVASLPHLCAVGMNGATAARIAGAQLSAAAVALVPLPSSSAAYAAMPLAEKERRWGELARYLR